MNRDELRKRAKVAQDNPSIAYVPAPATILELLDTVDTLESENKQLSGYLETLTERCNKDAGVIGGLVEALETSPCPMPVGDFATVGECVLHGQCGCDNKTALARAKEE